MKTEKPFPFKAYGKIPHLPGSKILPGQKDHLCNPGEAKICTEKPRPGDTIIVQVKVDGCCVAVANVGGKIVALNRAGYYAYTSPYEHVRAFDDWVKIYGKYFSFLKPGERAVGEWLLMAHGTRYQISDPKELFVCFDIFNRFNQRLIYDDFFGILYPLRGDVNHVAELFFGGLPISINEAESLLREWEGMHGAIDPLEGAVWRVERNGKVDFLAKYVRPTAEPGRYLGQDIYNYNFFEGEKCYLMKF